MCTFVRAREARPRRPINLLKMKRLASGGDSEMVNKISGADVIVRRRWTSRTLLSIAAAGASGLSIVPATAQPTSPAPQAESGGIPDIVVTAQKRAQRTQDIGISLVAISGDQLASSGVTKTIDLLQQVPGLYVQGLGNSDARTNINIRGVSQSDISPQSEGPIAVYVDNAYVSFSGANGGALFDIDRVEVLKGPQGTLYGRNATGGLIAYYTKNPTDRWEGKALQTIESYSGLRTEVAVGGPLSPNVGIRIAFYRHSNDGWQTNDFVRSGQPNPNRANRKIGEDDTYAGRVKLLLDNDIGLRSLTTFYYTKTNPIDFFVTNERNASPGSGPGRAFIIPGVNTFDLDGAGRHTYVDFPSRYEREFYSLTEELSYSVNDLTLTAVINYANLNNDNVIDFDFTGPPFPGGGRIPQGSTSRVTTDAEQYSGELRLSKDVGRLKWVLGAYYLKINGDYGKNNNTPPLTIAQTLVETTLDTESYAFFAQGDYDITSQLSATLGYRWTHDAKDYTIYPGRAFPVGYTDVTSNGDSSLKAVLNWKPNDDVLMYAGITRGTKAGGYNLPTSTSAAPISQIPYGGEKLTNYEGGVKTSFLGNRGRFNVSAFYYDYSDFQSFRIGAGLSSVVVNQDAKFYGVDADLEFRLGSGLSVRGGASYLKTKVYDVVVGDPPKDAPYSPKFSFNLTVAQEVRIGEGNFRAELSGNYRTSFYSDAKNAPVSKIDDVFLGNGRISYALDNGLGAAFFVNNIFDKNYLTYSNDASSIGLAQQAPGTPRWMGAEFSYRF